MASNTYSVAATLSIPCEDSARDVEVVAHFDADLPNDRCAWVTWEGSKVYGPPGHLGTLYLPTPSQAALEADDQLRTALREQGWHVL